MFGSLSPYDDRFNGSYKWHIIGYIPLTQDISAELQTKLVGEHEILSTFCESF
jgi:hypothetical protein